MRPRKTVRSDGVSALTTGTFDVIVVGGGITGAYTALDAARRGLRVAVLEKRDVASGTSSASSKMVHGGIRYIEQGNLALVRRSLLERQRLRRNAPHLVHRLPFMFPILSEGGAIPRRLAGGFEAMLRVYDIVGGWREGILHRRLTKDEVLARCPTLNAEDIVRGYLYFDARADDARLTLAVLRTAIHHGAVALNYAEVTRVLRSDGAVRGVLARIDGEDVEVRGRSVVMATGTWLRDWSPSTRADAPPVRAAKGVHIAVPWQRIRNDCTVLIPVAGRSRRATVTRWGDITLIGTTDDWYDGPLDEVLCTREEAEILLAGVRTALHCDVTIRDVVGSIAGCRALVASGEKTSDVKRSHEIRRDDDGLVTVVGGKLTTARHMGERAVDEVMRVLGRRARSRTARTRLLGGTGYDAQASEATGGIAAHLAGRYGTESIHVSQILVEEPELAAPIVPGHPFLEAEVVYAARYEMARTVDDVLSRRTRLHLWARDASAEAAERVGALLQSELGLDDREVRRQIEEYRGIVEREERALMGGEEK